MKDTKIQWATHTFNPWWGCVRVSPGCENCYAETFSHRLGKDIWGATAQRQLFGVKHWNEPLKWNRAAKAAGERHRVFCASMADVCEIHRDPEVQAQLDAARRNLAAVITLTDHLDWLLLTKRPDNFRKVFPKSLFGGEYPKNIWPGTTAEDQRRLDERAPHLLDLHEFPVRFLSCEPLLSGIDLSFVLDNGYESNGPAGWVSHPSVNWVIVGAESGGGAREFKIEWAQSIRRQCEEYGAAMFMKQLGRHPVSEDGTKLYVGLDSKGGDMGYFPADLQVREVPA